MTKFIIFIIAASCLACGNSAANQSGTANVKPSTTATKVGGPSTPTPTPFPNQAPVDKSKTKTFNGRGKVTKINLELVSVELDHEEIKGHMPKMIMEFFATEKAELEKLQVGDTVDFILEENDGQEKIVSIKKLQ